VCRPGGQEAFITTIRRVLDDPDRAAAMAKNARREVVAAFTWERHVEAILGGMQGLNLFQGS
jgi:glycosyltransferase involved in cell wall biosynthesis